MVFFYTTIYLMNISISNTSLKATINTKGAELNSLLKNDREYIWQANPEFWAKHSPILFPIVGTLKENTFLYNDTEFQLLRHGFARDNEFELFYQDENSVTFSLKSSEETLKNYPFEFELRIIYSLIRETLEVKYEVVNNSQSVLPFSIGGHPAFALPENFENYTLKFEKEESIKSYFLENDLLSDNFQELPLENKNLNLNYSLFKNDALIIKKMQSDAIEILENNKPLFKFSFKDFPNFGIWTKENAPFICLEPWFGYSDVLNSNKNILKKEGIILLEKTKTFEASFSVEIY